jgi:phosphoglycerate dehydrogenase-like enzyme
MNKCINSVLVLGLGKVGYLVALRLHETGFKVKGADLYPPLEWLENIVIDGL